MAQPGENTSVVKGSLFAGHNDIKSIVANLQKTVKADPKIAAKFKSDPRGVLAALGLNEDLQRELLRDMGIQQPLGICWFTDCIHTCWCTKCCITHLVVAE
jgi:hypothetical protein